MSTDPIPPSTDQPLPGLGAPEQPGTNALEQAVRRSLAQLHEIGKVDERHAGLMELALQLARSIRPGEKAYGVAQCAAQLLATFDKLMPPEDGGPTHGFGDLQAYLAGVGDARSGTALRDPS